MRSSLVLPNPVLSRRSLLVGAGAFGISGFLAACSAPGASGSMAGVTGDPLPYQLSWTMDYEFAGSYIADAKGYWTAQDLGVSLLPGGPNTNPEQLVASGQALVSSSKVVSAANMLVSDGIDLQIVGCLWQKYGLTVISRSDKPVHSPKDLEGMTVGVFASNDSDWAAFLQINGVDRSKITEVPGSFDITPLAAGQVDAVQGYGSTRVFQLATDVTLETLQLADFGYNPISAAYAVTKSTLDDEVKRAQLVSFLRGEIQGWQDIAFGEQFDEAIDLTVNRYGKDLGLNPEEQMAALVGQMDFVVTEESTANGLCTMSDDLIAGTQDVLDTLGIDADVDSIVTREILDEIYAGKTRV
ncbi:ABC transporter substrate-binding protein [Herbiconiux moechotypicola]|uniref:Thiamine pyrimidine synthase n=1 Tax=Herbiconiux moechotypicola TaxID=637393 RepID=A0ABN3DEF3_9MICO|nr:ABC transporter substrate-binding protein [Herbiconiux moechotypicola]MCS5729277.1 ABC transporter substrate-binding protein [Herbiconiux moechotypicola]